MFPSDLARLVRANLESCGAKTPDLDLLTQLLEVAYFASMRTEEGRTIQCIITFLDPQSPELKRSDDSGEDKWSVVKLGQPIALTADNLVKLSKASAEWASMLAVHPDGSGRLRIWGLID